ncbi:MAG: SWIM zinc finger family protein [Promethearchaeota archaeon]
MKIDITNIQDDLRGNWWEHIHSANFGFLNQIDNLKNHDANKDDIFIHKEIKEGERFPSVRYHIVLDKGTKLIKNEFVKQVLAQKLIDYIKEKKKLPYGCKYIKFFKNQNVQVNYTPTQFDNFALKVNPKAHGIDNIEKFFLNLEVAENPIKINMKQKQKFKSMVREWEIESSKDPNKKYTVKLNENGTWSCTCPNYTFRKTECRHIKLCKIKI